MAGVVRIADVDDLGHMHGSFSLIGIHPAPLLQSSGSVLSTDRCLPNLGYSIGWSLTPEAAVRVAQLEKTGFIA